MKCVLSLVILSAFAIHCAHAGKCNDDDNQSASKEITAIIQAADPDFNSNNYDICTVSYMLISIDCSCQPLIQTCSKEKYGLSATLAPSIVAYVVGGVLLFLLCAACAFCCYRRRRGQVVVVQNGYVPQVNGQPQYMQQPQYVQYAPQPRQQAGYGHDGHGGYAPPPPGQSYVKTQA